MTANRPFNKIIQDIELTRGRKLDFAQRLIIIQKKRTAAELMELLIFEREEKTNILPFSKFLYELN